MRNKLIPQAIRSTATLLYWFAVEAGIMPKMTVTPSVINVGTITGNFGFTKSFTISNDGSGSITGYVATTNPHYDLDLSTPTILDNKVYFSLAEGEERKQYLIKGDGLKK